MHTVGAVLDGGMLHPGRSGRNHLRALAQGRGDRATRASRSCCELVALEDAANRRAGGYSLGMRQRLGLAAALLGDPKVLVLDEPANGLDPQGIRWLRDFLRRLAGEGRAVLVSSHVLAEVAQTADDVVVIARGRSVAQAPLAEIMAAQRRRDAGRAARTSRELGDILYGQGAQVSGDRARDPRARAQRRADRAPGRRAPARDLRALARRARRWRRSSSSSPTRREARRDPADRRGALQAAHDARRSTRSSAARSASCC